MSRAKLCRGHKTVAPAHAVSPCNCLWGCKNAFLIASYSLLDPMEEDILQVVKYCTDLIDDKDLEKLYLIIKYMKR